MQIIRDRETESVNQVLNMILLLNVCRIFPKHWDSLNFHICVLSQDVCVHAQSCLALCDPMDCSLPGSSVHGIFKQEHWSGLPFPTPGDFPNPGIEPRSPAFPALAGRFFIYYTTWDKFT